MQSNRTLIAAGGIGAAIAAICCASPFLAVAIGAFGFTAWLSNAAYVLIPALLACLGLIGFGLYRRRMKPRACRNPATPQQGTKP